MGDQVHRALLHAVPHEFPAGIERCARPAEASTDGAWRWASSRSVRAEVSPVPPCRIGAYSTITSRDPDPATRLIAGVDFWISQLFNGVSYGALLFLLAGGLSLIFGMMRIVNMTHGSYYLLGGYVALTVIWRTGSFALAVVLGALTISLVGIAEWNAFLKRLSGQELGQVLTTMGFALIFQDLALVLWGGDPYTISVPAMLSGSFVVGQLYFPVYRIFIIVVAVAIPLVRWPTLAWTRIGAMLRATGDD